MNTRAIGTSFNSVRQAIVVPTKCMENIGHKYLYNEVLEIVQEERIPAIFANVEINLPSTTKAALERLKALNIKYIIAEK